MSNELVSILRLPFESLRTIYDGASEVRLYRNTITGLYAVGKRIDTLGLEGAMLQREATWLSSIDHLNIVSVQSVAKVVDPRYPPPINLIEMMMPYYELGSVADAMMEGRRFSIAEARDHLFAMLRGVGELHEVKQVLHRDVKAANVLLTGEANLVRLADLGVASPMGQAGDAESFRSAQIYTAPEHFTQETVDRRADIYSCGMLLLEMASGRLPWEKYEDRQAMAARLSVRKQAVLPRHLRVHATVPSGMRHLIRRCLSADVSKRPSNAAELANRLANIPLIDWRLVEDDSDRLRWEGASALRPERVFRVDAKRVENGWNLRGQAHINSWRRCVPDQEARDLCSSESAKFFDRIVTDSANR